MVHFSASKNIAQLNSNTKFFLTISRVVHSSLRVKDSRIQSNRKYCMVKQVLLPLFNILVLSFFVKGSKWGNSRFLQIKLAVCLLCACLSSPHRNPTHLANQGKTWQRDYILPGTVHFEAVPLNVFIKSDGLLGKLLAIRQRCVAVLGFQKSYHMFLVVCTTMSVKRLWHFTSSAVFT